VEKQLMAIGITLNRIYEFSSAHRLHTTELNAEQNLQIYDRCNNPQGHGHDYKLEVSLRGEPDQKTGMIFAVEEMDRLVRQVLDRLDHRHLDKEVDFFKTHVSTGEVIIQYLWEELNKIFPADLLYYLKLWETDNNYFEIGKEVLLAEK
jgi:6-pyruvoyltetrahydropterin/6-carboxytetrahydropterin synthase